MSMLSRETIKCPNCKQDFEIVVWESYNTSMQGDTLKVIKGDIFKHDCPNCKHTFVVENQCLFHNPEKEVMVLFYPKYEGREYDFQVGKLASGYTLRLETNYDCFRERVNILENGFNDKIFEALKFFVFFTVANDSDEVLDSICFIEKRESDLIFEITYESIQRKYISIPINQYDKFCHLLGNEKEIQDKNVAELIDFQWVADSGLITKLSQLTNSDENTNREENEKKQNLYCKYCGSQIDFDSIYCSKCGKKLTNDTETFESNENEQMSGVKVNVDKEVSIDIVNSFNTCILETTDAIFNSEFITDRTFENKLETICFVTSFMVAIHEKNRDFYREVADTFCDNICNGLNDSSKQEFAKVFDQSVYAYYYEWYKYNDDNTLLANPLYRIVKMYLENVVNENDLFINNTISEILVSALEILMKHLEDNENISSDRATIIKLNKCIRFPENLNEIMSFLLEYFTEDDLQKYNYYINSRNLVNEPKVQLEIAEMFDAASTRHVKETQLNNQLRSRLRESWDSPALWWVVKAVDNNYLPAYDLERKLVCLSSKDVEENHELAKALLFEGANAGDIKCQLSLASEYGSKWRAHDLSYYVEYDMEKALYWYKKIEDTNNPVAYSDLALFYSLNKNYEKANTFYLKLISRGEYNYYAHLINNLVYLGRFSLCKQHIRYISENLEPSITFDIFKKIHPYSLEKINDIELELNMLKHAASGVNKVNEIIESRYKKNLFGTIKRAKNWSQRIS